jgi:serine/threonine protein kinase
MSKLNWIGQTLGGRYQLETLLGQGGMSAVYRATDPNLRRTVAVKLIHTHLAADPEFVRRFEEEAAAVARLRHPNIIQVYDFNHDGDVYYMVLEFVPGETLQDKLRALNSQQKLLPFAETINVTISLCEAVQYAHNQGMIHRDLKPANVMITPKNEAILMDFGIAKIIGGENLTATGAMIGTVAYMAPEQIRGQRPDHRADIYSLGVMLFEMVSGRRPFEGDSAPSTMMMHLTEPVPDLRQINQNTPPQLVQIIEKTLAKEPAQRYQNAADLAADLRAVNLHVASSAINTAAMTAVQSPAIPAIAPPLPAPSRPIAQPQTGTQTGPQPTASPPAASSRSARPWIFAAVGMGILGLLIVLCGVAVVSGQFFGGGNDAQTRTAELAAQTIEAEATAVQATVERTETEQAAQAVAQLTVAAAAAQSEQEAALATQEMATAVAEQTSQAAAQEAEATATQIAAAQTAEAATAIAAQPQPTATHPPTHTPPPGPTLVPTNTPTAGPFARITRITLNGDQYEVYYETSGFSPNLPGTHIHFFFNTVAPENAGLPGGGPWKIYAGPAPFTDYRTGERPSGATQMCALVANPDHSVILRTGNCLNLP